MADKETNPADPPKSTNQPLHPVYSVSNIQQKIRTLDGVKVSYTSWVRLFKLHARGYRVLDHIDGTPPPAETDETYAAWLEIDSIVLQWIYGTLSDDLMLEILEPDSTAYEAWIRLQNKYQSNRGARIAALEHEFVNMTLKSQPSMEAYFQKLKALADQLSDLSEAPVGDKRLVLQMVRGLPPEYETMGAIINNSLPSWQDACEMLLGDQKRKNAQELLSGTPMINAAAHGPAHSQPTEPTQPPAQNRSRQSRPRGRVRGSGPRSTAPSGQAQPTNQTKPGPSPYPYWPAPFWLPPPCPYPTSGPWTSPWGQHGPATNSQHRPSPQSTGSASSSTSQAHLTAYDAMDPTQLAQAFSAMTMQYPDENWNMDTGAESHVTQEQGLQGWHAPESSQ